jgi:lysophospholipase L1-like esterase
MSHLSQAAARRWALQLGLLVVASVAGGLIAEGLSRVLLNPVNYLAVDPVSDSVLGIRLVPHAGGHDEWGFRNREVPDSADVVTIGDSQTYGVSAPANLAWPAQLGDLSGRRVYNLALGGYGPVQYLELLRTRALQLRPRVIVVGLYYGNDLWDAYRIVYEFDHWSPLRREGVPEVGDSVMKSPPRDQFLASVRDWLARHSVVYRLTSFTAFGGFARRLEFATMNQVGGIAKFQHPVHGAYTGLTPDVRLKALNLEDAAVREGLRLSLDRLERIGEVCRAAGVHLMVALIPTKERVFAPWIADLPEQNTFSALWRYEDEADRRVRDHLERLGIHYVSLLKPLQEAAAVQAIYPANDDGHPNSVGYGVIARAVAEGIQRQLAPFSTP